MKKRYVRPEMEVMEIETRGMLCVSGDLDNNAGGAALAPDYYWDDEDDWV